VLSEVAVPQIILERVVRQWASIRRKGDVAVFGVFRLAAGNVHRGAIGDQAEELGGEVLVHPDAAVGAGGVFDPPGVESVG